MILCPIFTVFSREPVIIAEVAVRSAGFPRFMFLTVLVYEIGPTIEYCMRCIVAEEEKERFPFISLDEINRFQI